MSNSDGRTSLRKRDMVLSFVQSKLTKYEIPASASQLTRNISVHSVSRTLSRTLSRSNTMRQTGTEENDDLPGDQCMLFPTYACQLDGPGEQVKYKVVLGGWTFTKPSSSKLHEMLLVVGRLYGGVTRDSLEDKHFCILLNQFRCQTLREMDIQLTLPNKNRDILELDQQEKMKDFTAAVNSGSTGRFEKEVILDSDQVLRLKFLEVQARLEENDLSFPGYIDIIEPHGISVISDIDDTIKVTDILDGKDAILRNTLFRIAREVPDMSKVFRTWAEKGVHFHYVSNSPWQVYPALNEFMNAKEFPKGSMHLRIVSKETMSFYRYSTHKQDTILKILRDFPHRKFILVGDSGEKDPEIYQQIYNDFPNQIIKIFIRDVTSHRAKKADRLAKHQSDTYFVTIKNLLLRESTSLNRTPSAKFAMDAMVQTEVPEEQQEVLDSEVPLLTKLEQFEARMKCVSSQMREGVFSVFQLGSKLLLDPVVAEEFLRSETSIDQFI